MFYDIEIVRSGWLRNIEALTRRGAAKVAARKILEMSEEDCERLFGEQAVSDYEIGDVIESSKNLESVWLVPMAGTEDQVIDVLETAGITCEVGPEKAIIIDSAKYSDAVSAVEKDGLSIKVQRAFVVEENEENSECITKNKENRRTKDGKNSRKDV